MHSTTQSVSEAIDALERVYEFRDPAAIRTFLEQHPDVLDAVGEAAAQVPRFLPTTHQMALEMLWDYELDDEEDEGSLFLIVPIALPVEETRERLSRLDREWLIDRVRSLSGRFNVSIRFT